jgi:hypothetical protein
VSIEAGRAFRDAPIDAGEMTSWVTRFTSAMSELCPLFTRSRPNRGRLVTSVWGHFQTYAPQQNEVHRCNVFAVGTRVASCPPHRSARAAFPHAAPTSGNNGSKLPYASQHPVSRLPGSESGACVVGPHSPRSLPFAPPTPRRIAPLCSSASQLLWQSQTSRARTSSATAPRLPDADRQTQTTRPDTRPPSFRCDPFACDVALDPGRATAPRVTVPHMLPSSE